MNTETITPQTQASNGDGPKQPEAPRPGPSAAAVTQQEEQAEQQQQQQQQAVTATAETTTARTNGVSDRTATKLAGLFYALIMSAVAVKYWGADRALKYWPYILAAVAFVVVTALLPSVRRWFKRATAQRRIGVILAVSIVCTLTFTVAVFLFDPDMQAAFLRLIFIMVVCSLPAVMYYLFIATKKYNLYNEFRINLDRLGLLNPSSVPEALRCVGLKAESAQAHDKRVLTYRQKFESVYGKFPDNPSDFLYDSTGPSVASGGDRAGTKAETKAETDDEGGSSNIFTFDTTLPVLLATLLIALGWLITLPPWDGKLNLFSSAQAGQLAAAVETQTQSPVAEGARQPDAEKQAAAAGREAKAAEKVDRWFGVFTPVESPVRFAFIGAYFFAVQLLFRRYVRRDLRASAYVNISLRIILAVVGIWVVSAAVKIAPSSWTTDGSGGNVTAENTLLVFGFAIGVFPRVAWQVVQAVLKRVASLVVPSLRTQLPVSDLDGLTVWHEARLEEEDIENIPNMATADVVDLMINTRLPSDRIIDWVDQAILYTHLGPEKKKKGSDKEAQTRRELLQAHGIRTASALVETYQSSERHGDRDAFEKILPGEGRNYMRSLVDAVGTNPNLKLVQTWRGLLPHTHDGDKHDLHEATAVAG